MNPEFLMSEVKKKNYGVKNFERMDTVSQYEGEEQNQRRIQHHLH